MFIIFVFISLLAYWITVQRKNYLDLNAKLKNIPSTNSTTYPLLGDIHLWCIWKWSIDEKIRHFIEVIRGYPTTLKVWFGSKLVIIINNPEDIKTILTSPHCTDKSSIYHEAIGGDGLFVTNGNKWKNQRRHLNTTFSPRVLNSYANEYNQFGQNLVAALNEHAISGYEFDITPIIGNCVTDLITRTIYGNKQQNFIFSKQCFELVESLMGFWGKRMLQIYFNIFLVGFRKIFGTSSDDKKLNKKLRDTLTPIISQKVKDYQTNAKSNESGDNNITMPVKDEHFLEKLTRLRFEGAIGITEYLHTSMTMFLAGAETTARSITVIILMLAIYEEHQSKIYEEICNFFEEFGYDDIDISNLSELKLLDQFIKETFRIVPVVSFFGRKPSRDIPIKEGIIPAGTDIFVSIENLHQHPHFWGKDAMKFNPENFLPEAVANREKCSYIPFSYGPRNCIGFRFAEISIRIAIVYLLKNYQLKTKLKFEDVKFGYGMAKLLMNENFVSFQSRNFNDFKI